MFKKALVVILTVVAFTPITLSVLLLIGGAILNAEGDGLEPNYTLTAAVFGYTRYAKCVQWGGDLGTPEWSCDFFATHIEEVQICGKWYQLSKWYETSELTEHHPVREFLARYMIWPLEWVLGILFMGLFGALTVAPMIKEE